MPEQSFIDNAIAWFVALVATVFGNPETWHLTFDSRNFGLLETKVLIEPRLGGAYGHSPSGLDPKIIPNLRVSPDGDIFAVDLRRTDTGYTGDLIVTRGDISVALEGNRVTGEVESGWLAGPFSGWVAEPATGPLRDYPAIADKTFATFEALVFDPNVVGDPSYEEFKSAITATADTAQDDMDMALAFDLAWPDDLMSHVSFRRGQQSAAEFISMIDTLETGRESARLSWRNDVAVLTVDTMMGQDTIRQIDAAFEEIAASGADALIIDLRNNSGGAFAVKPLVEHVIDAPLRAGVFASQDWFAQERGSPGPADAQGLAPWQGWSITSFWQDVQNAPLTLVEFEPAEDGFRGPVYVLVNGKTASAAELAADALKATPNVTLIGETTAGEMLSQMMFDVGGGFQLSLPVADYYSLTEGRIEGTGVEPDIKLRRDDDALAYTLGLIENGETETRL